MKNLYVTLICLMFLFITVTGYASEVDLNQCKEILTNVSDRTHIQIEDNIAYLRILPNFYNILDRNQKIILIVCTGAVTQSNNVQMITLVNNNQRPQFLHECTNCLDLNKAKVD